jgi:gliding motility-associated-like protein
LTYALNPIGATNSSGSFPNLGAGLFTITCTDVNGCSKSGVYTITEPTQLIINSITVTQPSCNPNNNGTAFINASGGTTPLNYSIGGLFGSNNFFGSMTSTTYNVVVKDGNGCTVSSSIVLQSLNAPSFQSVVEQDLTCAENQDGSIRVSANSNSTIQEYSLSPGGYINTNGNFTSLAAGTYIITVTDADGCTSTSQSVINAPDKLVINQVDYINDSCGSYAEGRLIFHVSGGTGSYTYQINPGAILQTTPIFTNLGIGDYRIQVTDANGCSTNSQVRITEKICCENVFMPNAFSPNNDGRNDEFAIRGTNGIELKDFLIFNRWGECVFKSRYLFDSWNGHYKGDDAEMGTYYYLVRYYCQSTGKLYTLKGDVILIR